VNILMTLSNPFTHDPRVYNEAQSLIKAGHTVTVLSWDRKKENSPKEVKDGINITRSFNTKFMNILPYDIFRLHFWWNKGYKDAIKLYTETSFDVIHCHDLSSLPIGIKLKEKLGLPLIYDAHEIWGYMAARDLPKWWANYYLKKEKGIIKNVDRIITVNEPLKQYFSKITNKPITIVMNCKPLQRSSYEPAKNEKITLIYIGTISVSRFLSQMVDVVRDIPDVYLIIAGSGSDTKYVNNLKVKCSKTKNVDFFGQIPMSEVLPMTKKADVVVCLTDPNDPNNSRASANKQFEAMVCGRPIICTKNTYPGILTETEKCGLVTLYTKKDLEKIIIKLRDNPKLRHDLGKNALNSALREYNWNKQEERLVDLYENIRK
jgi:glycosyltransferase involved in cell wall biosynthesis